MTDQFPKIRGYITTDADGKKILDMRDFDIPYDLDPNNFLDNRIHFNLGERGSLVYEKQVDGTMKKTLIPRAVKSKKHTHWERLCAYLWFGSNKQ